MKETNKAYDTNYIHYYTCPTCRKRTYNTRRAAVKALKRVKAKGKRDPRPKDIFGVYRCGNGWHLGHTPTRLRGDTTANREATHDTD